MGREKTHPHHQKFLRPLCRALIVSLLSVKLLVDSLLDMVVRVAARSSEEREKQLARCWFWAEGGGRENWTDSGCE